MKGDFVIDRLPLPPGLGAHRLRRPAAGDDPDQTAFAPSAFVGIRPSESVLLYLSR